MPFLFCTIISMSAIMIAKGAAVNFDTQQQVLLLLFVCLLALGRLFLGLHAKKYINKVKFLYNCSSCKNFVLAGISPSYFLF